MLTILSFLLGIICGIAISILIAIILVFLNNPIQQKITVIEKKISNAGPRPKGFIIEPKEEADEIREEIIEKNRREGRDTKISDLL